MPGTIAETVTLSDVMVPMRDGVRLATDVTMPAQNGKALPGPFPTLFYRTPYDKTAARRSEYSRAAPEPRSNAEIAAEMARAGFAVMVQDCRGRYASGGVFAKYLGEGEDGYDTLDWARAQPWCSGRFGTFGLSYSAHVQTALAVLQPDGLDAMFIDSGGFWNAYQGGVRRGGAFELKQATWAMKHAALSPRARDPLVAAALAEEDVADWFTAMPWRRGVSPLRHVPEYDDYLMEQWEHGTFDDFWQKPELYAAPHYARLARCPVFLISGWFDPYAETVLEHFKGLRAAGGHAECVVGPWLHGQRSTTYAGDCDFGECSVLDGSIAPNYQKLRLDWFRTHLLGDAPAASPGVRWFAIGGASGRKTGTGRRDHGGTWRKSETWPPETVVATDYHLSAEGGLGPRATMRAEIILRSDPSHPVPTIGGAITSGEPVMEGGAFDQTPTACIFGSRVPYLPLAARPDVLVFVTQPLEAEVEIAGPVTLHTGVIADVPDLDLTAKLIDWGSPNADYPKGYAMNLTDGILRLRYRDDFSAPTLLEPGIRYDIRIDLLPIAARFAAGHRIRVDIAGSNFPRFDVNPQTGEDEGRARGQRIAHTRLQLGEGAARLTLPVLPAP